MKKLCVWAVAALLMAACTPKAEKATDSGLLQSKFQTEVDGKKTDLFTLRNKNNMEVCITNFGGRIVSVMVPDKDGQMRDVVLGFDSIQDYISKPSDFGATIGRYANRINQGQFTLDGVEYQLPRNNYGHCLHGGPQGFQYRVFDAELLNPQELQLTYRAEDGEEGFPGNITCKVVMKLTDDIPLTLGITVVSAILLLRTGQHTKIKGDAAIAMISVGALAVGYLLMNLFSTSTNLSGDVCSTLFGSTSILTLTQTEVWLCAGLSVLVVAVFVLFYNKIFAVTFDEDFSKAVGTKAEVYNLVIAVTVAVVIVLAMNLVGSLLISALVIFPAISAMRVYQNFRAVTICSAALSVVCAVLGILVSILGGTPVGSTIVAVNITAFLLFSAVGRWMGGGGG